MGRWTSGLERGPSSPPPSLAVSGPQEESHSQVKRFNAIQVMAGRDRKNTREFPGMSSAPHDRRDAQVIGPMQLKPLVSSAPLTHIHPNGFSANPMETSCQNHPTSFAE